MVVKQKKDVIDSKEALEIVSQRLSGIFSLEPNEFSKKFTKDWFLRDLRALLGRENLWSPALSIKPEIDAYSELKISPNISLYFMREEFANLDGEKGKAVSLWLRIEEGIQKKEFIKNWGEISDWRDLLAKEQGYNEFINGSNTHGPKYGERFLLDLVRHKERKKKGQKGSGCLSLAKKLNRCLFAELKGIVKDLRFLKEANGNLDSLSLEERYKQLEKSMLNGEYSDFAGLDCGYDLLTSVNYKPGEIRHIITGGIKEILEKGEPRWVLEPYAYHEPITERAVRRAIQKIERKFGL